MSPSTRFFVAIAAVGALASGGGAALAQPQGLQGSGAQQPDLSAILHLRPDQQGAYHAWQAASKPTSGETARLHGTSPEKLASETTPQRLDQIGMYLTLQLQLFHRSAEATRAFYAQLSPDQQRTFDQITVPPSRRGAQSR